MKTPNRNALRGTRTVFRYTMQQHYKAMSVRIFLIILFILALAAFPLMRLISGGESEITQTEIKQIYLQNETPFTVSEDDIRSSDERYASVKAEETDAKGKKLATMLDEEPHSAAVVISAAESGYGIDIRTYYGENSAVTSADAQTLANVLTDTLHQAILRTANISEAQEIIVNSKAMPMQVLTVADYQAGTVSETDTFTHMFVNLAYAYLVLILSALAMSYIFQLCMEEKVSKLVESLLVSVAPAALLTGKIIAASCMLFIGVGVVITGLICSYFIAKSSGDVSFVGEFFRTVFDADLSTLHISIGTVLLLAVCLLLAYAICAFFSGIVGSCCSKTEDTQQASLAVVLFIMVGYLTASLTPAMESDAVNYFCALFPITSIFTALPNFICGKISLPVFILALVLQAVTAYLLARLAGAVYRMMLLYRGSFPKFRQIQQMLKENRAAEKAAAGKEDTHES